MGSIRSIAMSPVMCRILSRTTDIRHAHGGGMNLPRIQAADRFSATVDRDDRLVRRQPVRGLDRRRRRRPRRRHPARLPRPRAAPTSATGPPGHRPRCGRRTSTPYARCVADELRARGVRRLLRPHHHRRTSTTSTASTWSSTAGTSPRPRAADDVHRRRHGRDGRGLRGLRRRAYADGRVRAAASRSADDADRARPEAAGPDGPPRKLRPALTWAASGCRRRRGSPRRSCSSW